jgi:hypothetical protein
LSRFSEIRMAPLPTFRRERASPLFRGGRLISQPPGPVQSPSGDAITNVSYPRVVQRRRTTCFDSGFPNACVWPRAERPDRAQEDPSKPRLHRRGHADAKKAWEARGRQQVGNEDPSLIEPVDGRWRIDSRASEGGRSRKSSWPSAFHRA